MRPHAQHPPLDLLQAAQPQPHPKHYSRQLRQPLARMQPPAPHVIRRPGIQLHHDLIVTTRTDTVMKLQPLALLFDGDPRDAIEGKSPLAGN
jgi:hypothetical protein